MHVCGAMAIMDREQKDGARREMPADALGVGSQPAAPALAMGEARHVEDSRRSASAPLDAPPKSWLEHVHPTVEPLKVCLDDDSSIEDDDEDMFDDDAFTFGDEDFEALMSHDVMKRMAASMQPSSPGSSSSAPAAPPAAAQHSLLPLHQHTSLLPEKAAGMADPGAESPPSTAASSSASLGALTHTSHTSCSSMSKRSKSKRRVSLHNDVTVVPIPERTEYNLIRERIWSSATELYQNAARNTIEFAAEGFDWRNAAEDEHFVQGPSGQRIHPIHYMNMSKLGNSEQEKHPAGVNSSSVSMDVEPLPS